MNTRKIGYIVQGTGELIENHREAVEAFNTGENITVVEFCGFEWVYRTEWAH